MSRSKCKSSSDVVGTVLYFSRYCTVRLKMFYFLCLFFVYYLCEKYCKLITVEYYIVDCVSWVPRLTLLDLQTNGLRNMLSEWSSFVCRGLTINGLGWYVVHE